MHKNCVILKYNIIPLILHAWDHVAIRLSSIQIIRYFIYIFIEIFLGRQPCQDVRVFRRFRDWLCPNFQVVAGGLVEPKLMTNMYVGESKIIRNVGACFAVVYTAGWAW